MTQLNTLGIRRTRRPAVDRKFSGLRKLVRSRTSAVAALINMMTGASIRIASANVTPWAARLNVGSGMRAMTAAMSGPSVAIITHVAAKGAQKRAMLRCESRKGHYTRNR